MITPISLEEIQAAQQRLRSTIVRTPLIRLDAPDSSCEIYLKLEILQPIGSFKLRGAGNAIASADPERLKQGVVTASAGNMAQGVAWHAQRLGIPCHVIVPEHAPATKLDAVERMGGKVKRVPFEVWWEVLQTAESGLPGLFIHPVSDPAVVAGNASAGMEILEDLPDVNAVLVPFGGGGLACGIGSALVAKGRTDVDVIACEVETAAPLAAALKHGAPSEVVYHPSFVDGIGSNRVLEAMWPLVHQLIKSSITCTLSDIASAIRLLANRHHVIAEGAGATAVAAAMNTDLSVKKAVCVVSGGNIDTDKLLTILGGGVP